MPDGIIKKMRQMKGIIILAINPGSTSTKFALYDGFEQLFD